MLGTGHGRMAFADTHDDLAVVGRENFHRLPISPVYPNCLLRGNLIFVNQKSPITRTMSSKASNCTGLQR